MIHTPRSEALRYLGYRGAQPDEATAALLETMLVTLRDQGEDAAFDYIRREILGNP